MHSERLDWTTVRRLGWFVIASLGVLVSLGLLYGALLPPILISCFFTYLLLPLVNRLERRRVPRILAITILVVGTLTIMAVSGVRLMPLLYQQLINLLHLVPGAVNALTTRWLPVLEQFVEGLGIIDSRDIQNMLSPTSMVTALPAKSKAV